MIDNVKPCPHCGQLVSEDNLCSVNVDGTIEEWCEDCIYRDAFYCKRCGQYHAGELVEVRSIDDSYASWCESCASHHASVCDSCNGLLDNAFTLEVYVYGQGYQTICDTCLDDYYCCSVCGDYCTEEDARYQNGEYYCPSCVPNAYVDEYHHTEGVSFLHVDLADCGPYLGVELEMEFPTESALYDAAKYIRTAARYGHLYECKEDSSLDDYGFECVTQPATPLYHMTGYDDVMLTAGALFDATSHDNGNCGLHIHIDRTFFNDTGIGRASYRAGYILDTIFCNNEPYIIKFTRRSYSQMNRWAQMVNLHAAKEKKSFDAKLSEYRIAKYTRYQAVNLENDDTIELRLFRGTLNRETYYATVEFVTGLAYLTRALLPVPEYAETLAWDDVKCEVLAALETNGLPVEELINYLKRRGI